ncbi:MAG: hypothetical protein RR301_01905 [Clostridia bacterium]
MMLTQETLLKAYPHVPTQVNARIDRTLEAIHRQAAQQASQQPPKRYAVRLRFATVLVVLLLMLVTFGIAAGLHYGVFDFMRELFEQGDVLPEAQQLVQNDLATLQTEHTQIKLTQAVYDGGNLRLVYSVQVKGRTAPITSQELNDEDSAFRQALAADGVSSWGCDCFYLDGVEYGMTNGSTSATLPGTENGEALCYLDLYLGSSNIAPQKDFAVRLPIVRKADREMKTLDFMVRVGVEAPTTAATRQVQGATVTVRNASLSPVRAYVNLHIEKDESTSAKAFELLLADWQDAVLVDGQGNELTTLSEFQVDALQEGQSADYSFIFLPTAVTRVWIAPTIIDDSDQWVVDMTQGIELKQEDKK